STVSPAARAPCQVSVFPVTTGAFPLVAVAEPSTYVASSNTCDRSSTSTAGRTAVQSPGPGFVTVTVYSTSSPTAYSAPESACIDTCNVGINVCVSAQRIPLVTYTSSAR